MRVSPARSPERGPEAGFGQENARPADNRAAPGGVRAVRLVSAGRLSRNGDAYPDQPYLAPSTREPAPPKLPAARKQPPASPAAVITVPAPLPTIVVAPMPAAAVQSPVVAPQPPAPAPLPPVVPAPVVPAPVSLPPIAPPPSVPQATAAGDRGPRSAAACPGPAQGQRGERPGHPAAAAAAHSIAPLSSLRTCPTGQEPIVPTGGAFYPSRPRPAVSRKGRRRRTRPRRCAAVPSPLSRCLSATP